MPNQQESLSFPVLKVDIETLLGRFQEVDSVRFEDFSEIWRDMKFSTIFYGGMRSVEMNRFTREALSVACFYFLPPYTFQIRVGALYLLYGLYSTQLCQPKQKIRIALKDWTEVEAFHRDLLSAQHFDAAYIFRQMRLCRAFHFTAMPVHLTFRTQRYIPYNIGKEEFKDVRDRVADLITSDSLEEILNIHEHYQRTKCLMSADKSQPPKALSLVKEEFVGNLEAVVTEHQQWKQEKNKPRTKHDEELSSQASQESEGSERAKALARIKSKSYSTVFQAPKSRRHRQVHLESSESGSDHGNRKRARKKRPRKKPTGRAHSTQSKDREETSSSRSLSMPVIPEEDCTSSEEEIPISKRKRTR
ncbi:snRNA-activating protein complex subunit 1 [Bombina bombina]|uniref:snRNA-activating protein complex subunit 1 n=1 Tax=Bombina bombina TaxID=8345 RepID=UPI00235B1524|nr:snRNA-activating protein complex subunit 1 [Bombina bombina]